MKEKIKIWNTGYDEIVEVKDGYIIIRHSSGVANLESEPYSSYQDAIAAYGADDVEWKKRKGGKKL